jgi:transcriptional regulator with XRE-family HTH domain
MIYPDARVPRGTAAEVSPARPWQVELAQALRAVRRARGLRQAEVAARMGTTQSCVSDFERARSNPNLRFVARYASAVGARVRLEVVQSENGPGRDAGSPADQAS